MDNIRCLIIDDEPVAQRILENYLADLREFKLVAKCLNALKAREILQQEEIDLIFLDLEMPKLKGFAFLRTLDYYPGIIITTAHREFALDSYDFEVVDYLLKPITFERFLKAVNRFKKSRLSTNIPVSSPKKESGFLWVKSDRKTVKIRQSDIVYIEGMNNYIKINTAQQTHVVYSSLHNILQKLTGSFLRIHKSYIINKEKISAFTKEQIELGEIQLPIGHSYRAEVRKQRGLV